MKILITLHQYVIFSTQHFVNLYKTILQHYHFQQEFNMTKQA